MKNGFKTARDIAARVLAEESKWESVGAQIKAAINRGLASGDQGSDGTRNVRNVTEQPSDDPESITVAPFVFNPNEYDWEEEKKDTPRTTAPSNPITPATMSTWSSWERAAWNGAGFTYPSNTNKVAIPGIPMAKGGIVTRPTYPILAGESGPEAIIPLKNIGDVIGRINGAQYSVRSGSGSLRGSGYGATSNYSNEYHLSFNVDGGNIDEQKLAQKVVFEIKRMERASGMGRRV
jgi:hypothetical protein